MKYEKIKERLYMYYSPSPQAREVGVRAPFKAHRESGTR